MYLMLITPKGLAIIENGLVKLFLERNLPEDTKTRFEQLFKAKAAWKAREIAPYVQKLCLNGGIDAVLLKWCRKVR